MKSLGTQISTFKFSPSIRRRLFIPLLAAAITALAVSMLLISFTQAFGIIPVGREMANVRVTMSTIAILVTAPVVFLAFGLPVWLKHPLVVTIYENGLIHGDAQWLWDEFNALSIMRSGKESICQLYQNNAVVCQIVEQDSRMMELMKLLTAKTDPVFLPRLTKTYESGEEVSFGNFSISKSRLQQQDVSVPAANIGDCLIKSQSFIFRRNTGTVALLIASMGLPNGHLLEAVVERAGIHIQK